MSEQYYTPLSLNYSTIIDQLVSQLNYRCNNIGDNYDAVDDTCKPGFNTIAWTGTTGVDYVVKCTCSLTYTPIIKYASVNIKGKLTNYVGKYVALNSTCKTYYDFLKFYSYVTAFLSLHLIYATSILASGNKYLIYVDQPADTNIYTTIANRFSSIIDPQIKKYYKTISGTDDTKKPYNCIQHIQQQELLNILFINIRNRLRHKQCKYSFTWSSCP